jgi:hypothetical protein
MKTALRKLRQTLGDDAEAPRYIENLPRRGYRFIAPVDGPTTTPMPQTRDEPDAAARGHGLSATTKFAAAAHGPRRAWLAVLAGAAVLIALVLTLLLRTPLSPPKVLRIVQLTATVGVSLLATSRRMVSASTFPN